MAITVYNYALSPCGEKVRLALIDKGIAFEDVEVDLGSKENLSPDFLRLNPRGLVPVLVWDGEVVADSTVILEYIEDRAPTPPLRPAAPLARAAMRAWTKHVDEVLHPAWPGIAWPILVRPVWLAKPPEAVRAMLAALPDPTRRARQERLLAQGLEAPDARESLEVLAATCAAMAAALARGPWLAGDAFSLADIAVLPYFVALDAFGLERLFRQPGPVAAWYDAACARPAFGGHPLRHVRTDRLDELRRTAADLTLATS